MDFLKNLFFGQRRRPQPTAFTAPLTPEIPMIVVGDIHGRFDLLKTLLDRIEVEFTAQPHLCFVGDYVDRGEQSADVLALLRQLPAGTTTTLMGNHERMMLDFLDQPEARGGRWMRNGGLQSLASFGVGSVTQDSDGETLRRARNQLRAALPEGLEDWLRHRPLYWQNGNILVTHAGADPALPPEQQLPRSLMWGHGDFLKTTRTDGLWVAYGHYIRDQPSAENGRISLDTGAYYSNRLTAAVISGGKLRFIETTAG